MGFGVPAKKGKKKVWPEFLIGGISGCTASCITHPLDLIKVRLQISSAKTNSILTTLKTVYAERGILSFYRGLSGSLLRQGTYTTGRMGLYLKLREKLADNDNNLSFWKKVLCAFVSGAFGATCGSPADVTLIRMQADNSLPKDKRRNYKHVLDGLYKIIKNEGVLALYTGVSVNIFRAMIMTAGQIASYDQIKEFLEKFMGDTFYTQLTSSMIAGFVAAICTSPVDVIKTRIMNDNTKKYSGITDCFLKTLKENGFRGFYKGFIPYFSRLGPNTMITLLVAENTSRLFSKWGII